ncbi:unnamed protein product [Bursaphelenchus okinawaensis]|uniref:KANSL3 helical domain-containing protein n=1 Tax=Bursaphelenchus okinawaensis TaxID=465554 RepID=A0A811L8F7_9BILA|nr:unnamed protein product [Bursaphelenchus okinawaensis]CAG9118244.1 unnamed protein product [Bursaphelenchus okinawaensis]
MSQRPKREVKQRSRYSPGPNDNQPFKGSNASRILTPDLPREKSPTPKETPKAKEPVKVKEEPVEQVRTPIPKAVKAKTRGDTRAEAAKVKEEPDSPEVKPEVSEVGRRKKSNGNNSAGRGRRSDKLSTPEVRSTTISEITPQLSQSSKAKASAIKAKTPEAKTKSSESRSKSSESKSKPSKSTSDEQRPRLSSFLKWGRKCVDAFKERPENSTPSTSLSPAPAVADFSFQDSTMSSSVLDDSQDSLSSQDFIKVENVDEASTSLLDERASQNVAEGDGTSKEPSEALVKTEAEASESAERIAATVKTEPEASTSTAVGHETPVDQEKKPVAKKRAPRIVDLSSSEPMMTSRKRRIKPVAKFSPSRDDRNRSLTYDTPPVKVPKVTPLKINTNVSDVQTPSGPPPTALYPYTPNFYMPDHDALQLALESQKRQYELAQIQSQEEAVKRDLNTSLLEGRKRRNKALSISQFAPELLKNTSESLKSPTPGARRGRVAKNSVCEANAQIPTTSSAYHHNLELEPEESLNLEETPPKPKPVKRYQMYGTQRVHGYAHRPFFEEMKLRKQLNPMALGLNFERKCLRPADYFYREVLVRHEEHHITNNNEDVDVLGGDFEEMVNIEDEENEVLVKNPAMECVADVRKEIPLEVAEDEEMDPIGIIEAEVLNMKDKYKKQHLKTMLSFISTQRLIDLNTLQVKGGCSLFYTQTLKNASRMRENLLLYTMARMEALREAHEYLVKQLPDEFLGSYLNLLRFLKCTGTQLPLFLTEKASSPEMEKANVHITDYLDHKMADPGVRFGKVFDIKPIPGVSLVLVYPQITVGDQIVHKHAHENMFRNLLPAAVRCVEKVELKFQSQVDAKVLTHMCLDQIRQRVRDMTRRRPDDHVFLAGWGTSCLLNFQAIRKTPGVTGLLNFSIPLKNHLGTRGSVDDNICITYCPSLFVIGESASNCDLVDIQQLQQNMICDSGVIVVGNADKNLFVSPVALSVERVSQHCVDRLILEHTIDFIKQVVVEGGLSAKDKRPFLRPVKLPSHFEVDVNTLKGRASGVIGNNKGKPLKASKDGSDPTPTGPKVKSGAPRGRPPKNLQQQKPMHKPTMTPIVGVARNTFTQALKRSTESAHLMDNRIQAPLPRVLPPGIHGQTQRILLPSVRRDDRQQPGIQGAATVAGSLVGHSTLGQAVYGQGGQYVKSTQHGSQFGQGQHGQYGQGGQHGHQFGQTQHGSQYGQRQHAQYGDTTHTFGQSGQQVQGTQRSHAQPQAQSHQPRPIQTDPAEAARLQALRDEAAAAAASLENLFGQDEQEF